VHRTVEFVLSDKLGETYRCAKDGVRTIPLAGTIILPGVEAAEGVAKFCFMLVSSLHLISFVMSYYTPCCCAELCLLCVPCSQKS
jgi:uncharacterized membrane protein YtjA (UPF0391 family)